MPSHFTDIGIDARTNEEIRELIKKTIRNGKKIQLDRNNEYHRWEIGKGIEFWVGFEFNKPLFGKKSVKNYCYTPYFSSKKYMKVVIENENKDNTCKFCRGYEALLLETPITDFLPIIFDVPNHQVTRSMVENGDEYEVELTAFTEGIRYFDDEDQYYEAQGGGEPEEVEVKGVKITVPNKMASDYYIPTGTFSPKSDPDFKKTAHGILAGTIIAVVELVNPETSMPFYYLELKSGIGDLGVVVAKDVFQKQPMKGGMIDGSFWFTGKIKL